MRSCTGLGAYHQCARSKPAESSRRDVGSTELSAASARGSSTVCRLAQWTSQLRRLNGPAECGLDICVWRASVWRDTRWQCTCCAATTACVQRPLFCIAVSWASVLGLRRQRLGRLANKRTERCDNLRLRHVLRRRPDNGQWPADGGQWTADGGRRAAASALWPAQ